MAPNRWLLPRGLDLLGMLNEQAAVTLEGMEALEAWAEGDERAGDRVRECEHTADDRKRKLRQALTEALTTPLEPEDIFELSGGLDGVINRAKDLVREAEVMGSKPDGAMAEMARQLLYGVRSLCTAFEALSQRGGHAAATAAADEAVKSQRRLEHVYRTAMSSLLEDGNLKEVTGKRELYRRFVRCSDHLAEVGERVWYAVLKVG